MVPTNQTMMLFVFTIYLILSVRLASGGNDTINFTSNPAPAEDPVAGKMIPEIKFHRQTKLY